MNGMISAGPGRLSLAGEWSLIISDAGAYASPADIAEHAEPIRAPVPGTVAQALERAGLFDRTNPEPLNHRDYWYLASVQHQAGPARLVFDGLATIADVFVNGRPVLSSLSQFVRHEVPVTLTGSDEIAICFRALKPHIEMRGPRARWRPQLITPPGMRLVRTTALGHMPGWCPDIDVIGPYRPIHLVREGGQEIDDLRISTTLDDDDQGILELSFRFSGNARDLRIACAGATVPVTISPDDRLKARLVIPGVEPWWPHTHGTPALHDIDLLVDGRAMRLGRTGFRTISLDEGQDGKGFRIEVNSVPVFCRGAVWTNADIVRIPGDRESYRPWLEKARDAGMNMIRIGGTMTYESRDFFDLCDELGIMVWQDFMFANFDYPAADPNFQALLRKEATDLLSSLQGTPSLTVLCGGSEMFQQAAMLGLPEDAWMSPITNAILPEIREEWRPDVIYVPNSPFGGSMPFSPNEAVTHYYGVGAYCLPLDDARRAEVRFAAESLAFAHVPEQETLDAHLPVPPVHHPDWKARVPRDRGASWDFEDIRDHYLQELYGLDPARLRREDPARYLDFSRAVTVEIVEATYAEWRRPGSPTGGALVWTLQDLLPGAGWGVIDSTGLPKPVWHGLRRAFRPVQVILSDERTAGLNVHAINESAETLQLTLSLVCYRDGRVPVVKGLRDLDLLPCETLTIAATELFGAFFDTTYSFRFGPPSHDVTVARLTDRETGREIASAFHFPRGRMAALREAHLTASLEHEGRYWVLALRADRLAESVAISAPGWLAGDNWFHLAPETEKRIVLQPISANAANKPEASIRHLGTSFVVHV